jgi:hypothetical protein
MIHAFQQRRIVRLADADKAGAGLASRFQFRLGFGDGRDAGHADGLKSSARADAPRRFGRAEPIDKISKGGRADDSAYGSGEASSAAAVR